MWRNRAAKLCCMEMTQAKKPKVDHQFHPSWSFTSPLLSILPALVIRNLGPLALTAVPPVVQGLCMVVAPRATSVQCCPTSPLWRTFQNSSCSSGAHSVGCSHQPEASVIFCKSPFNLSKDSLAPPLLPSSWGRQQVSFHQEALHSLLFPHQCSP